MKCLYAYDEKEKEFQRLLKLAMFYDGVVNKLEIDYDKLDYDGENDINKLHLNLNPLKESEGSSINSFTPTKSP